METPEEFKLAEVKPEDDDVEVQLHVTKLFHDHFTLAAPSSTVRFRSKNDAARVFENKTTQFVLEETYDPATHKHEINVKRMKTTTKTLQLLRATYTIVCIMWTGFFFVFCLQVLLFLVLDLAIESGTTEINGTIRPGNLIGVILAILVFIHGFASAMVIASNYCADTWTGHYIAKQFFFSNINEVVIDWIFFTFLLLIPLLVMCITLFAGLSNWWTITSLVWLYCVMGFFVIFAANVVFYEVRAAIDFVKNEENLTDICSILKRCILLRQIHSYSGRRFVTYLARTEFDSLEATDSCEETDIFESTRYEGISWWSKFTQWKYVSSKLEGHIYLFKQLDSPVHLHTIDDVLNYRPFITKYTWNLERVFCRPKNSRYIAIVEGPGALTRAQMRSSFICSIVATILIILLIVALLVWFQVPAALILVVFGLLAVYAFWQLQGLIRLMKVARDLIDLKTEIKSGKKGSLSSDRLDVGAAKTVERPGNTKTIERPNDSSDECIVAEKPLRSVRFERIEPPLEPDTRLPFLAPALSRRYSEYTDKPSEGIFLVTQYHRVTEATESFCFIMTFLEISFFVLYPAITLFALGNWQIGLLFLLVAFISLMRYYINAVCMIEEAGTMELVKGADAKRRWANMSRLSDIVGSITSDESRIFWIGILAILFFIWISIFLGALGQSSASHYGQNFTYLDNFYYPAMSDDMRYPTCQLGNHIHQFEENATLADYAFLTILPYKPTSYIEKDLAGWFKGENVTNDNVTVADFRGRNNYDQERFAVHFDLFRFNNGQKEKGVISIRGTHNKWVRCNSRFLCSFCSLRLSA